MLEVILSIFMLCFAVVGLIECFRAISLLFLEKKNATITLIPICGHVENIEMILRNEISSRQWHSGSTSPRIVCLDLGVDEETRYICEIFNEEYDVVEFYSLKEFNEVIQQSVA